MRLRRRSTTSTSASYEEPTAWAASSTSTGWSHELGGRGSRHPQVNVGPDASDHHVSRSLTIEQLAALLPILGRRTSSSSGWFLLWEGYGELKRSVFDGVPSVAHLMRNYYLLSGPLNAFGEFPEDPDYWWPFARAATSPRVAPRRSACLSATRRVGHCPTLR